MSATAIHRPTIVEPPSRRVNPWLVLVIACLAQFMVVLDATVVNIALPSVQRGLHFSAANLQWVVNGYTLIFGGFLLLGGRAGGPPGPQAPVHRRGHPVHGRLPAQRGGPDLRDADRRSRPPGSRWRARLPRRAVDRHHHLQRRGSADQGAWRLERDRGRRRGRRSPPRRHPHRRGVVAVGLLRQRAGRHRHRGAGAALRRRVPGRRRPPVVRPRRRGRRHQRPRGARVRDRQGAGVRLGLGPDARARRDRRRPAGRIRRRSRPAARRR